MMAKRISELEIRKIKKLHSKGYSILAISNELNRSDWTIRKYIKNINLTREPKVVDLTGEIYGKLVVLELDHVEKSRRYWKCKCECGNITVVIEGNLKSGTTKSCGCLRRESKKPSKIEVQKIDPRRNSGGVFFLQAGEIILKGNYESEKKCSKIKEYKLSPEELAAYLKELETKEVKRRGE
nr:MAG TPA: HOMEOBOX PROTEIN PAX-6/DNA COMPLEX, PAIRED DOMAIN, TRANSCRIPTION, PROTEIN-DNA.5A [Caudoviricetes sp.]